MGMYERASLIGAHLQIQSEPSGGTRVMIQMPVKP
jgi:signal transduction histidine kinase